MILVLLGLLVLQVCSSVETADTATPHPDGVPAKPFIAAEAAAQANERIAKLKEFIASAKVRMIEHGQETQSLVHKAHPSISIDGDYTEILALSRSVTSRYFDFFHNAWKAIEHQAFDVLQLAMDTLEHQLRPWASAGLVKDVMVNIKRIVDDTLRIMVNVGAETREYLMEIHVTVVRHLWALQRRAGIFAVSQWCHKKKQFILDWGRTEVERLVHHSGLRVNQEFEKVVDDLFKYVESVLKFSDENPEDAKPTRTEDGFDAETRE